MDAELKQISKEKFSEKYIPEPMSGCWLWTSSRSKNGYGVMDFGINPRYAHRMAWALYRGKILKDMEICHSCDVRLCVNPDHLYQATHKKNMADQYQKARTTWGENHANSKLTEKNAKDIILDRRPQNIIAKSYKVSRATICMIKKGKLWGYLQDKKHPAYQAND